MKIKFGLLSAPRLRHHPFTVTLQDAQDLTERMKKVTRNLRGDIGNPNFSFEKFTDDVITLCDDFPNGQRKKSKGKSKPKFERKILRTQDPAKENERTIAFWDTINNYLRKFFKFFITVMVRRLSLYKLHRSHFLRFFLHKTN